MKNILETENTSIRLLSKDDGNRLLQYFVENEGHLKPWEPSRSSEYYTLSETERRISCMVENQGKDTSLHMIATSKGTEAIVAIVNYTNIVRGVFQACNLGYSIAHAHQGVGMMQEILEVCNSYVFKEIKLHRIMANYIPENIRSESLLNRLGFEKEGYAKSYLKIAGEWKDHYLTSKISRVSEI